MRKVLNLVLSYDSYPYDEMVMTQERTWDSIPVEGVETIFYFGESKKQNTHNKIYLPVKESLHTMGRKLILALEWALENKEFDFIARPHSCVYVDKQKLIEYAQTTPTENFIAGPVTVSQNNIPFIWGGTGIFMSRDVAEKIVANKDLWNHSYMEDESVSLLATTIGIPLSNGYSGGIDKMPDGWRIISYGGESITFNDFSEVKRLGHHFYRCKNDGNRDRDKFVMEQLFKNLK